jgi:hypothetical protein
VNAGSGASERANKLTHETLTFKVAKTREHGELRVQVEARLNVP